MRTTSFCVGATRHWRQGPPQSGPRRPLRELPPRILLTRVAAALEVESLIENQPELGSSETDALLERSCQRLQTGSDVFCQGKLPSDSHAGGAVHHRTPTARRPKRDGHPLARTCKNYRLAVHRMLTTAQAPPAIPKQTPGYVASECELGLPCESSLLDYFDDAVAHHLKL